MRGNLVAILLAPLLLSMAPAQAVGAYTTFSESLETDWGASKTTTEYDSPTDPCYVGTFVDTHTTSSSTRQGRAYPLGRGLLEIGSPPGGWMYHTAYNAFTTADGAGGCTANRDWITHWMALDLPMRYAPGYNDYGPVVVTVEFPSVAQVARDAGRLQDIQCRAYAATGTTVPHTEFIRHPAPACVFVLVADDLSGEVDARLQALSSVNRDESATLGPLLYDVRDLDDAIVLKAHHDDEAIQVSLRS